MWFAHLYNARGDRGGNVETPKGRNVEIGCRAGAIGARRVDDPTYGLDFETRPTIGRTAVLATANGKYRSLNIDVITHFVIDDLKYEVVVEYTCTNRSTFFLHQRLGRSQRLRLLSREEDRCLQGRIGKHPVISLRF